MVTGCILTTWNNSGRALYRQSKAGATAFAPTIDEKASQRGSPEKCGLIVGSGQDAGQHDAVVVALQQLIAAQQAPDQGGRQKHRVGSQAQHQQAQQDQRELPTLVEPQRPALLRSCCLSGRR